MGCKDVSKVKYWRRRRQLEATRSSRRRAALNRKIKKLRQLIPGGTRLKRDRLFLRTAEHILQLRLQVNMLKALSKMLSPK